MKYLIAIDQGTTSSRAMAFDLNGVPLTSHQIEITQYFPNPGWVEHDGEEILATTIECVKHVLNSVSQKGYKTPLSIGITNQRETCLLWDRHTGEPIGKALVWQDRRTADFCAELKERGLEPTIVNKTGLLIDPYFSASKLNWMLHQSDDIRELANKGELAFGTIDSFLLWHLTGGRHQTDVTNASRTMLMNIHTMKWDEELLDIFGVPIEVLPEICENTADFGVTKQELFGCEIPIGAMIGDQQAAAVGQGCIEAGMSKSTYGTGCFLLHNTGNKVPVSQHKLLATVAYQVKGEVSYALEGSIFIAGAAVQWLRDGLSIIPSADVTEQLACQLEHNNGVYMVPAFVGLGAPHWDPDARGAIYGITRDTGVCEFVRAGLESVVYQTHDLIHAVNMDSGKSCDALRVDGGMAVNNWLMQFMADVLDMKVEVPKVIETTALGAAFLAGISAGAFTGLSDVKRFRHVGKSFSPNMTPAERVKLLSGWDDAVRRTLKNKDD